MMKGPILALLLASISLPETIAFMGKGGGKVESSNGMRPAKSGTTGGGFQRLLGGFAGMQGQQQQGSFQRPQGMQVQQQGGFQRPQGMQGQQQGGFQRPQGMQGQQQGGFQRPQGMQGQQQGGFQRPQGMQGQQQGGFQRPQGGFAGMQGQQQQGGFQRPQGGGGMMGGMVGGMGDGTQQVPDRLLQRLEEMGDNVPDFVKERLEILQSSGMGGGIMGGQFSGLPSSSTSFASPSTDASSPSTGASSPSTGASSPSTTVSVTTYIDAGCTQTPPGRDSTFTLDASLFCSTMPKASASGLKCFADRIEYMNFPNNYDCSSSPIFNTLKVGECKQFPGPVKTWKKINGPYTCSTQA